jgi:DNA-binding PadR family transcriptional regulator
LAKLNLSLLSQTLWWRTYAVMDPDFDAREKSSKKQAGEVDKGVEAHRHNVYSHNMNSASTKRSPLALAILVLLYEAPMHPYGMRQQIKRRGEDEIVNVSQPNSLYQTIARLERSGLIVVASKDQEKRQPERTTYELTSAGRLAMIEWTRELLSTPSREFPEFPAAISVLPILTPKDASKQLELRSGALEAELTRLHERLTAMAFVPRLFRLEVEYLHAQVTAELRWVSALIDDLRTGSLTWNKASVRKAIKELVQKECGLRRTS